MGKPVERHAGCLLTSSINSVTSELQQSEALFKSCIQVCTPEPSCSFVTLAEYEMDIDPTGELEKSLIKLSKEEKKAKKKHRQETQGIIVTALGNPGDRIGNFLYFAHEFNSVGVNCCALLSLTTAHYLRHFSVN